MALAAAWPQGSGQGQSSGLDCRTDVAGTQGRNIPAYRLLVVASPAANRLCCGQWEKHMAMVTIRCPVTGQRVSTGIETVPESVNLIPPINARLVCPGCGRLHVWSILDAELVNQDLEELEELPQPWAARLARLIDP